MREDWHGGIFDVSELVDFYHDFLTEPLCMRLHCQSPYDFRNRLLCWVTSNCWLHKFCHSCQVSTILLVRRRAYLLAVCIEVQATLLIGRQHPNQQRGANLKAKSEWSWYVKRQPQKSWFKTLSKSDCLQRQSSPNDAEMHISDRRCISGLQELSTACNRNPILDCFAALSEQESS